MVVDLDDVAMILSPWGQWVGLGCAQRVTAQLLTVHHTDFLTSSFQSNPVKSVSECQTILDLAAARDDGGGGIDQYDVQSSSEITATYVPTLSFTGRMSFLSLNQLKISYGAPQTTDFSVWKRKT